MNAPPKRRAVLLGILAVAACTSPEPAYYTLAAVPGQAMRAGQGSVKLRRIGLAGYLDRPQIVRTSDPYRLNVAAGERWGEPVGDMFGRVLSEDLGQRLPGRLVFSAAGSLTTDADVALAIDVQRFDADSANQVTLLAQVSVEPLRGRGTTRTVRLTLASPNGTTQGIVATMSAALGQLADQVAPLLA